MKLVIGTRASRLAMEQTRWVAKRIEQANPGIEVEIKKITTKGDTIQHLALDKIGDKGIFTEAIERALLSGEIDLAVHSMKDMPSELPEGLRFAAVPAREDARDVLVAKECYRSLEALPKGARIGCGSKRRVVQLLALRPDLTILPIRGNIDTRIAKIESEGLDGILLAAAGLHRLGLDERITQYFSISQLIPASAQGALALQVREDRGEVRSALSQLGDPEAEAQVVAERAFLESVGGGCHLPVGAYCRLDGPWITLTGLLGTEEGDFAVAHEVVGERGRELETGKRLAFEIKEKLRLALLKREAIG